MKGQFNPQEVSAAQREFEGQIKLINSIVSAFGIASKNKRVLAGLEKMNLMDDSTAVDLLLGSPDDEKVKCPEADNLITRTECLDYSGSHHDVCSGCEIGKATKDKLIPRNE